MALTIAELPAERRMRFYGMVLAEVGITITLLVFVYFFIRAMFG
ncbi:MAG TPA: hypothetical protein VLJ21_00885 [Candidatus Binatia bacterium]|nr:hypothetical protein [Candidatus Binatia bacterium]